MLFPFYNKLRNKIAYRLLIYILLFSGLVTIIITATQLYVEYRRDVDAINDQFNRIETIFKKPIVEALWFFNEKSIRLQLEGISNLPDIESLNLVGEGNVAMAVGQKVSKYTIKHHLPLIYTGKNMNRQIGSLEIVASMTNVYSRLYDRLVTILITQGIKTFLVSAFIFMIFHFLVVRHISSIGAYLKEFSFKGEPQPLALNRKTTTSVDELDQTVSSINEMAINLHEAYETIQADLLRRKKTEKKLQKARAELEQKVVQRTKSLKAERDRAQNYLDIAGVIMLAIHKDETVVLVNRKGCAVFGLPEKEILGSNWFETFIPASDRDATRKVFSALVAGKAEAVDYFENKIICHSGEERIIAWHNTVLRDPEGNVSGTLSSGEDITERKQAEEQIKASLNEKEILLKEIHHRVKNNMQMIQSLINLQMDRIENPEYRQPLIESNNRIRVMALVHESLYKTDKFSRVDLKKYFTDLVEQIMRAYGKPEKIIDVSIAVDPLVFDMDKIVSCGLIMNELLTNAMKYAFNHRREGRIGIVLRKITPEQVELVVSDNGTGLPEDLDPETVDSLGLRIVQIISKNQLDGAIHVDRKEGLRYTIRFPL